MKQVYLKNRKEWRDWLKHYHDKSTGIWLIFYKKHTGKPTLNYNEAVEEALCFGWIDSVIRKIDDERYVRKMTPRNANSQWSELNKNRIAKLELQGLMAAAGAQAVKEAKAFGLWDKPNRPQLTLEKSMDLDKVLAINKKAKTFFDQLAPSYQKQFIGWIETAKRPETKDRRIKEIISLLEQGKKLGMK